jgi:hypothetical protein
MIATEYEVKLNEEIQYYMNLGYSYFDSCDLAIEKLNEQ